MDASPCPYVLKHLCSYVLMFLCFRVSDKSQNSWDASPPLVLAFCACVLWQRYHYHTTKTLHAEYLTSYTNTLQLIDCQHFTQCKMLPILPTHNLHNPHAATRHKHGRMTSRHRGTEKPVAPTDFSTSLCRITHRTRPNRLHDGGVRCVRCMQGSVRYFEIILHS